MIGFTNSGPIIVENIKMYQSQWDLAEQGQLVTKSYPGFRLIVLSFVLTRLYKTFPTLPMTADYRGIEYIHLLGSTGDVGESYYTIQDTPTGNTFVDFFQTTGTTNTMQGSLSSTRSYGPESGIIIQSNQAPNYDPSLINPYCYLSLVYYLVPMY